MHKNRLDRLNRLSEALQRGSVIRLREAAQILGVSEMTVRRDVAACNGQLAYLGGYIVNGQDPQGGLSYVLDWEKDSHAQNKQTACAVAASLIEEGDTVFIDCGTTTPHLAAHIPSGMHVTVVCYAMNVAEIIARNPNATLVLLGGLYHRSSVSFAGEEALATLRKVGINKAFLSAGGIHATRGVSCSNFHEVAIKRAAMATAVHNYLVADSSKFGKVKPAFFADLSQFEAVVTDPAISAEQREALASAGVVPLTAGRNSSAGQA